MAHGRLRHEGLHGDMKHLRLTLFVLACVAGPAAAQPIEPACYARTYDAAHLAANPAQRTLSIRVSFASEHIPGGTAAGMQSFVRIEMTRRGSRTPIRAIGTCVESASANRGVDGKKLIAAYPKEAGLACVIAGESLDEEGGMLLLDPTGGVLRAYFDDSLVMRHGAEVSRDKGRWIELGRADRIFRLERIPAAACEPLRAAINFR